MKANELRVSNIIKLTDTGEIMTVTGIMHDSHGVKVFGITTDGTYCNAWIEHCEPIKITEQRLMNLGFTPVDDGYYVLRETRITWDIYAQEIRLNGCYVSEPTFIHEFQNVIHALTGTELTLTENPTNHDTH